MYHVNSLFFFFFFKCNFEMNGSFIYSTTVLLNELSFHVVGIVIQRQGCLMLQITKEAFKVIRERLNNMASLTSFSSLCLHFI